MKEHILLISKILGDVEKCAQTLELDTLTVTTGSSTVHPSTLCNSLH